MNKRLKIICAYDSETTYGALRGIDCVTLFNTLGSTQDRARARIFMRHWGAMTTPFAMAFEDNVPVQYFYSECSDSVEQDIVNYLKVHLK